MLCVLAAMCFLECGVRSNSKIYALPSEEFSPAAEKNLRNTLIRFFTKKVYWIAEWIYKIPSVHLSPASGNKSLFGKCRIL
jgi:hypothetical protein